MPQRSAKNIEQIDGLNDLLEDFFSSPEGQVSLWLLTHNHKSFYSYFRLVVVIARLGECTAPELLCALGEHHDGARTGIHYRLRRLEEMGLLCSREGRWRTETVWWLSEEVTDAAGGECGTPEDQKTEP